MFDIGARLTATSEHQHCLDHDLAPVMSPPSFTTRWDPLRETITETDTVSERAESPQTDMTDHPIAAAFHHQRNRAVTVHLRGALLSGPIHASTHASSQIRRALPRTRTPNSPHHLKSRG